MPEGGLLFSSPMNPSSQPLGKAYLEDFFSGVVSTELGPSLETQRHRGRQAHLCVKLRPQRAWLPLCSAESGRLNNSLGMQPYQNQKFNNGSKILLSNPQPTFKWGHLPQQCLLTVFFPEQGSNPRSHNTFSQQVSLVSSRTVPHLYSSFVISDTFKEYRPTIL